MSKPEGELFAAYKPPFIPGPEIELAPEFKHPFPRVLSADGNPVIFEGFHTDNPGDSSITIAEPNESGPIVPGEDYHIDPAAFARIVALYRGGTPEPHA